MKHIVKIKLIEKVTHDVLKVVTDKPMEYNFTPGQATNISINKNIWKEKKSPFTFTCLPEVEYLEFTIKTYPTYKGVTNELLHPCNARFDDAHFNRQLNGGHIIFGIAVVKTVK